MLVCFATENKNFDSLLATHFEKASWFLFFDTETREIEKIKHKRGFFGQSRAVHLVTEKNPALVITGNIEPDSFDFLRASGVQIVSGVFGVTAREAWDRYQHGRVRVAEDLFGAGQGRIL
jgi:predicted Fe-Mo cluster-binding NifX family protein